MKTLKNAILIVAALIIVILMTATVLESLNGTDYAHDHIYGSWWFVVCWAVLGVASAIYIIGRKLQRNIPVMLIHAAFLVILLGALLSWLTAVSGEIHLRKGDNVSSMTLADGSMVSLGFTMRLNNFHVDNYPGTDAPMDYVSDIVADGEQMDISMNNIGQHHGYRFLQAAYDSDMQGTRLNVYHDPWGIGVTYTGYALLLIGLLWTLFSRKTRLRALYQKAMSLQTVKSVWVAMILGAVSCMPAQAEDFHHIDIDKGFADDFGRICVLYNSRICPINTVATDFVTKLSGRSTWNGMSANEIFAGWVFDVTDWEHARMIEVKSKEVQQMLGITDKWASFDDFWNQYNEYKLEKALDHASDKQDNALLKKLREADEKFNIIRMLYSGEMLRMFPYTDKSGHLTWLAPGEKNIYGNLSGKEWNFVRRSMDVMAEALLSGNTDRARVLAGKIYDYQHLRGAEVMPSRPAVYAELVHTAINSQRWPVMLYLTLALMLVIGSTWHLSDKMKKWSRRLSMSMLIVMLAHTTILLVLRWWISGHLPISNGFETMQFMAWLVLVLTVFVRRRLPVLENFGLLLASFALLVAMLTDSNPQITQLMPVLQSPLLSMHVMVIMFSYSLFGLMALVSVQGIVAHLRGNADKTEALAALSGCLLYPAVALLAIGIFVGAVWANVSWGRYWSWDAKETWALITMLLYAAPLHGDIKWLNKPVAMHVYLLVAFLSVLMTYFGVNYVLGGMHSYA